MPKGQQLSVRTLAGLLLRLSVLRLPSKQDADDAREDLVDCLLEEFVCAANTFGETSRGAIAQGFGTAATEDAETHDYAEALAYGWPSVHDEPTLPRAPGRFAKSFPLKFPMGIADLYDARDIPVTPAEYVQHVFRLPWTWGPHGERLAWALLDTVLLAEARGKGFAAYRQAMRRYGRFGRHDERQVLTKAQLCEMLQREDTARALVGSIQNCGRDVRSAPMHWAQARMQRRCER